jgi:uncharacterized protein (TIRG00374 family)
MSTAVKERSGSKLSFIIKALLGSTLLALVIYWANPQKIYHSLLAANPGYLALAILFVLASFFLGIKRWQVLSRTLGIEAKFSRYVVLHFLGLFFNNFIPSGVGGDFVKAHYLSDSNHQHRAYLSVVLDRYVGLLVMLLVGSALAFWQPRDQFHFKLSLIIWAMLIAFICGFFAMLIFSDLLARLLNRYHKKVWADKILELNALTRGFLKSYYVVGVTFWLSIASQALSILAVYELSLAVGARADVASMFVIVPLVFLISVLPISFGGLGTREAAFVYLLSRAFIIAGMLEGDAQGAAAGVAFLWLAINLLASLPGAASYYLVVVAQPSS